MVTDSSSTITVIQGRGTAYYTPIEQYGAESEHTDIRSDIYALGATLYHLYACQAPPEARKRFLNPTVMQPVQKINPEVSNDISEGIHWALEMHPDNRPKNVGELRQALLGQIRRQPVNEYSGESPNLGEALRSNSLIIFAALILLILAIVITVI
jgi:serine/threonine-protein kinase